MNNQDYKQKKRECWEEFIGNDGFPTETMRQCFNYAFDRAYALGKQEKNSEETVIKGWVARDFDGDVFLYQNEPDRNEIAWNGYMMHSLPVDSFPDLTWDSDPEPVEIIIKRKKK
jgi:hypothetical protein